VKKFAEACLRGLELDVSALVKKLAEPGPGDRMDALDEFAALAPRPCRRSCPCSQTRALKSAFERWAR
jgi:hypothetical protein